MHVSVFLFGSWMIPIAFYPNSSLIWLLSPMMVSAIFHLAFKVYADEMQLIMQTSISKTETCFENNIDLTHQHPFQIPFFLACLSCKDLKNEMFSLGASPASRTGFGKQVRPGRWKKICWYYFCLSLFLKDGQGGFVFVFPVPLSAAPVLSALPS